ncbi:MAG: stage II sporulation protein SpoIID, partial [Paenibacillaceae bacterium]|nr:stage II sporulation protein SpoIID [Paenibacillaceae bacterium]
PEAALQAQAVAARTYVLRQGAKYGIAHVSDTTFDQVYNGIERESLQVRRAAEQTAGWKLVRADGTLQDAFFHSNAGNWTSDAKEVWNVTVPGIGPVPSPDDAAQIGKLRWFRVVTEEGRVGYVRSDVVQRTEEKTPLGWAIARVTGSTVNVRSGPTIVPENIVFTIRRDARLTILAEEEESSAYRWIRGPFLAPELLQTMRAAQVADMSTIRALTDLSVVSRGETSGRVTLVAANGTPLIVARPDQYRTLLGLPSTRFDIENTAQVTAQTSDGTTSLQTMGGASVISAQGAQTLADDAFVVANAARTARVVTAQQQFRFIGYGFGHGLGMSQWGAYSLAQLGYGAMDILRYYYPDAIVRTD